MQKVAACTTAAHPRPLSQRREAAVANGEAKFIKVRGARQHNLKGVDVDIPRDQLTVCCGPSGSGKILAGHGHDLCRRPAALRRKPQRLRPAVRRPDAEAARSIISRASRRPSPSSRSTPATRRAARSARSPRSTTTCGSSCRGWASRTARPATCRSAPVGRRDHRQDHGPSGRHEAVSDGPAGNPRRRALRNAVGRDAGVGLRADPRRRPDLLARRAAADRPPAQARRRSGDRPRDDSPRRPLAHRRQRRERPVAGHAACCTWPIRATTCPSRTGTVEIHSQHFACDRCGRSFEPLSPHNFSFNSPLGWCPACEGLGRADRHESGGAAARSEAHAGPRRGGTLARRRQPDLPR